MIQLHSSLDILCDKVSVQLVVHVRRYFKSIFCVAFELLYISGCSYCHWTENEKCAFEAQFAVYLKKDRGYPSKAMLF